MRFWELVCLALQGIRRAPLRAILTTAGVAIATGALVSMVSFALGLQRQVETPFEILGLLHNVEVSPASDDARREAEEEGGDPPPRLDDTALETLAALPRVDMVYPDFQLREVTLERGKGQPPGDPPGEPPVEPPVEISAFGIGVPRDRLLSSFFGRILVAGAFFSPTYAPEVIPGVRLTERLGFDMPADAVGELVTVVLRGRNGGADQPLEVRIVGVFEPPGFSNFGPTTVLLPVDLLRVTPGVGLTAAAQDEETEDDPEDEPARELSPEYDQVVVRVDHPSAASGVAQAIRDLGFDARSLIDQLAEIRGFFLFIDVLLAAVGTVALIVAGLGILNTLLMSVLERTQEIGIYKAIGASTGDVRVIFLSEAALVGFFGGLGGLALARVVCWVLQQVVDWWALKQGAEMTADVFHFPAGLLAGAVGFSILISVGSGLYPATRAARIDPIQALRRE